jgi:hypothetical protein
MCSSKWLSIWVGCVLILGGNRIVLGGESTLVFNESFESTSISAGGSADVTQLYLDAGWRIAAFGEQKGWGISAVHPADLFAASNGNTCLSLSNCSLRKDCTITVEPNMLYVFSVDWLTSSSRPESADASYQMALKDMTHQKKGEFLVCRPDRSEETIAPLVLDSDDKWSTLQLAWDSNDFNYMGEPIVLRMMISGGNCFIDNWRLEKFPINSKQAKATSSYAMEFKEVDPNKIPDELTMLANVTKANYEKIKTWEGRILSESKTVLTMTAGPRFLEKQTGVKLAQEPNELTIIRERVIEFKIDIETDSIYKQTIHTKPLEYLDIKKNITYHASNSLSEMKSITLANEEVICFPNRKSKDGRILSRMARKRDRYPSQTYAHDSDPRSCFNVGNPIWIVLSQLSENLRLSQQGSVKKAFIVVLESAQAENSIIYRLQMTSPSGVAPYISEQFILDGRMGFNPTSIEVRNDKEIMITEVATDFIEVQGIFMPVQKQVIQNDGQSGLLREEEKWILSDIQINKSLPKDTFTLDNILQDGDDYVDETNNKKYRYKEGGKLVEILDRED